MPFQPIFPSTRPHKRHAGAWTNLECRRVDMSACSHLRNPTLRYVHKPTTLHAETPACGHAHKSTFHEVLGLEGASERENAPSPGQMGLNTRARPLTCPAPPQKSTSSALSTKRLRLVRLGPQIVSEANFQIGDKESLRFKVYSFNMWTRGGGDFSTSPTSDRATPHHVSNAHLWGPPNVGFPRRRHAELTTWPHVDTRR